MRIDSSGNLLVGITSTTVGAGGAGTTGFRVDGANGVVQAASDGTIAGIFNRTTSDGDIVDFRKNGVQIGYLGTVDGDFNIYPAASGHKGLRFGNGYIAPTANNTTVQDNAVDLGLSTHRFKDLHLGGDANVGGDLVVTGDLTINGTTTTLNTATLNVEDKNITLNYGTGDTSSTADGAGITIQDAVNSSTDATILWNATTDKFEISHSLDFPDNALARFGDGADLRIYHDGNHSYIDDTGTGRLNIRGAGDGVFIDKYTGENMITAIADGAVTLFHNGSAKIATTSGGASVTGALSVSGNLGTGFFEIGDDTATTTATTQVSIASFSASSVRSCKLLVQVTNTTDSTYHFTEIAIIHDGTDTYMTETGTMFTGTAAEATFTSDISSGSVRLLATPASTDSMTFKVVRQMITA